jgi:FkbM family methyltransferase
MLVESAWAFMKSGRYPSRRAVAALAKLHDMRLEKSWPYLKHARGVGLNLGFDDILEFQYARSAHFFVVVIGAYDGIENDPIGDFILQHECSGLLLEPQPAVFQRLEKNFAGRPEIRALNFAVDASSGAREFFHVPSGIEGFPAWTEQLASFDRKHIEKHEALVSGLSSQIASHTVPTISFSDLLDRFQITEIDVLQIDAEGCDALMLSWFPFDRLKPAVIHFEIAHISTSDLEATRMRLKAAGYRLYPTESPTDEMAVLL